MDSQRSDRKPRNYYVDYSKRGGRYGNNRRGGYNNPSGGSNNARFKETPEISFGHKGFLITSIDEVKSYLEMRNIFEGYFETLYKANEEGTTTTKTTNDDNKTTEDELESELKQLRVTRPFKQLKTHCRNSIFINIDINNFAQIDPIKIVDQFFDELMEKREIRTSNTFKVLPVIDTFRNSPACAKQSISNVFENSFKDEGERKFFIEFQTRGNYKLNPEDKMKMIEVVADTITELRPQWSVDREKADYIISLVALRNVCCLSILKDYFKRSKYNVVELCKDFVQSDEANHVAGDQIVDDEA